MKRLLQRILNVFNRKGVTNHQKWLPYLPSKINEEISFLGTRTRTYLDRFQTIIPKAIDSGSISGKTYSSRFSGLSLQRDTDFCKDDLIANDPFFSQVEQTINNVGLERASEMLGAEVINIYTKLMRNRLERHYRS
jgi:hypothetical protein